LGPNGDDSKRMLLQTLQGEPYSDWMFPDGSIDEKNGIFEPKDKKSKDKTMYAAHLQYGYTLKDKEEFIGVHLY